MLPRASSLALTAALALSALTPLCSGCLRPGGSTVAVAAEPDCTVWVPAGWTATPTEDGTWVIVRGDGS